MGATTLRIERLDGDLLVIEAAAMTRAFFEVPMVQEFEEVAGKTRRDATVLKAM
jgi:hypothetical protein